jgi:hypothetical protein
MDTGELVEGGAAGLGAIVNALERAGVNVIGAYLIRITATDGFEDASLRIVTNDDGREVLYKYVGLRRDGAFPKISGDVTMTPVRPSDIEASRVLDYARRIGNPPVKIRGVLWRGLYIEDALVVKYPISEPAVA